jgi:hypothetical protein
MPSFGLAAEPRKMTIMLDYYGALFNTSIVRRRFRERVLQQAGRAGNRRGYRRRRRYRGPQHDRRQPRLRRHQTSAALSAIKEGVDLKSCTGDPYDGRSCSGCRCPTAESNRSRTLKGKKIGFTRPRSISETMAKWKLRKAGMEGQATLVSLGAVGAGLSASSPAASMRR